MGSESVATFNFQGLKGDGPTPSPDLTLVQPHIHYIVQFITVIAQVRFTNSR